MEASTIDIEEPGDLDAVLAELREVRREAERRRGGGPQLTLLGVFAALLDRCVLWPSLQRDALLSFAIEGIHRPVWSAAILDGREYHEAQKLIRRGASPERASSRTVALIGAMRRRSTTPTPKSWKRLDGSFGLPDPNDEHVVAAAVVGAAEAIGRIARRFLALECARRTCEPWHLRYGGLLHLLFGGVVGEASMRAIEEGDTFRR